MSTESDDEYEGLCGDPECPCWETVETVDWRGSYEKRIDRDGTELHSGLCAAGDGVVREGEPFVIRHHPTEPGGIFHLRCRPMGTGWYTLTDEAPDV